jgi:tetratricopeptide (TPR) repeat protein
MQPRRRTLVAVVAIVACALISVGCKKFNSRRLINEGNKLYKEGKFEQAAATFEEALKEEDLDVAHYNLGITYVKLFMPGSTSDANKAYADKAAEQLSIWLKNHPKDNDARKMMTSVWVDSGDYEKALAYWQNEHEADPKNRDVMGQMASINLKAGNFDETIKWIVLDAEVAPNTEGKVKTLVGVGNVVWSKLSNKEKVVGAERIHVADTGISACQKVLGLDPNNVECQGLLAAIFNFRSLAHGASWAAGIDRASSQNHAQKHRVLLEEAKKKAAAEQPPAPTAPTTPTTPETSAGG